MFKGRSSPSAALLALRLLAALPERPSLDLAQLMAPAGGWSSVAPRRLSKLTGRTRAAKEERSLRRSRPTKLIAPFVQYRVLKP